jgi:hypothetical protein
MGPAMAAMQQYQSDAHTRAQGANPTHSSASAASVSAAAAAAAAAGFNPHQMQQIAAALASGGYNPFAAFGGASVAAEKPPEKGTETAEPVVGDDGGDDDGGVPSTAREVVAVRQQDGSHAKRFKVSEDRGGHAG